MKLKSIFQSILIVFLLSFGSNALASLISIDFESETVGSKANGYTPTTAPGVHFTDSAGANLMVGNYGNQGQGTSLAVFSDTDGSGLRIDLDFTADSLSLDFGNDDPFFSAAGDIAYLELFLNSISVGSTSVVMNRDDIMNQTISIAGTLFDSALFIFTNPDLSGNTNVGNSPTGLTEVIDNIQINQAVPEPTTLALMGLGLVGMGWKRRKAA